MGGLALDGDFPILLANRADGQQGSMGAVHIEAHGGTAKVLRVKFPRAMQAAFFAHSEQHGDRRVRQLVINQGFCQRDQHRAARAIIPTQSRGAIGDNPVPLTPRLRTLTQRHGIHMCGEQKPRARLCARQVNDQITHFGRQLDALVGGIVADGAGRHAGLLQLIHNGGADGGFKPRYAVNREQADQHVCRIININKIGGAVHGCFLLVLEHRSASALCENGGERVNHAGQHNLRADTKQHKCRQFGSNQHACRAKAARDRGGIGIGDPNSECDRRRH